MNIRYTIKTTNMELTDAIDSYVENKLKAVQKLIDSNDTSAHADVEVGKTTKHHQHGKIFRAEINLHIAGSNIRAVAKEENLYSAIDVMKDEIMRRLRKVKTKRKDVARRSAAVAKRKINRSIKK